MTERTFIVPGEPRGKGRPRFSSVSRSPHTDSETAAYERKVAAHYRKAHGAHKAPDGTFVEVDIVAYLGIPASATKKAKAEMAAHKILPSRKPDADNIIKIILDALNGVAYKDDAWVHRASCVKYYSFEPRVEVQIREVW